jgi:preprotein translocase subunit YajC
MLKTILIIIISVTFVGVFFFIIVRNLLKRKLDQLVKDEREKKLNNFK